jgi:hypothetical protein
MNATDIIIFVGIAGFIIATQVARRPLNVRRLLTPLLIVGFVAYQYLHSVPTVGGDLPFEITLSLAGAAFGVLAASLIRVERDATSARVRQTHRRPGRSRLRRRADRQLALFAHRRRVDGGRLALHLRSR